MKGQIIQEGDQIKEIFSVFLSGKNNSYKTTFVIKTIERL